MNGDAGADSMQELFRVETENQAAVLTEGLLVLEREPQSAAALESLMRAAHSIKGAASIINLDGAVHVAHQMEDCLVAAQQGQIVLGAADVDCLLQGVDMLLRISRLRESETAVWLAAHKQEIDALVATLAAMLTPAAAGGKASPAQPAAKPVAEPSSAAGGNHAEQGGSEDSTDRVLRLSSEHLDRMLALASEMQVEWQWIRPFSDSMLHLKRRQAEIEKMVADLESSLAGAPLPSGSHGKLKEIHGRMKSCRTTVATLQEGLEMHTRSISNLSHRLYHQTVASRMRPFGDSVPGFRRMVRDLARSMGKQVRLEVSGLNTAVDRDILEKIESPLNHLIRNAMDHGIESPEMRRSAGKSEEGVVSIEAVHQSGMLRIIVSDDGCGLDLDALRRRVVKHGYASRGMVKRMTESELITFLFLPKFSMKEEVTEISGRGVGLDVVANMIRSVRGTIHSTARKGEGMRFELLLPITLSVIRALLVEIGGEGYAFPLVHIDRTLKCGAEEIERIEGRQFISLDGQQIGLVSAREVLNLQQQEHAGDTLPVVVIGPVESRYGLIVDRFIGEHVVAEKVLHPRLGKVKDISASAVTADGAPLLIFNVNDLHLSITKLVDAGKLGRVVQPAGHEATTAVKRVLVIDDSITVREVERKLLVAHGYQVEVAVDGVDGLNTARTGHFDLLISDVDMPRMDGIELVRQIKRDSRLKDTPVVIVSYKESGEDRMRGLEAGADAYLTKSSFHDETLLETVIDLIGEAA